MYIRKNLRAGRYLFVFASLLVSPILAESVPPVPSAVVTATPRIPEAGKGAWREYVQLVWNGAVERLERRRYEVFDPFAADGDDVFWQPRDVASDHGGRINGTGVLTWKQPGVLQYGSQSIISQYRGDIADGRAQGRGIFVDRSGLRYDGEWSGGLMDGEGDLLLPNGDVYRGGFRSGRLSGHGVYIDATGRVYDGSFSEGLRDGPAQVAEPNGYAYASVWKGGVEDKSSRHSANQTWAKLYHVQADAAAPGDLAITVAVGGFEKFCCHPGAYYFGYASTSFADRIEIFPDAPRMLDVWRGRSNIVVEDAFGFTRERGDANQYSFLNYNSNYNTTVPLQFGLENRSTKTATVVGAYLDIARSEVDMRPALQSIELTPLRGQSIDFSIENYGWSPARNAHLTIRFQSAKGLQTNPVDLAVGDISGIGQFSFAPALEKFGVQMKKMASVRTACANEEDKARQACLNKLIRSGIFDRLSDFVFIDDLNFGVHVSGQFSYDWTDADDRAQHTVAPFDAFVPLGTFVGGGECEGGDVQEPSAGQIFELAENRANYRIPIPLGAAVGAGTISRWQILLNAAKSSHHDMRIVLQFADGRELTSRKISLLLFRPRTFPTSIRPLEPSC